MLPRCCVCLFYGCGCLHVAVTHLRRLRFLCGLRTVHGSGLRFVYTRSLRTRTTTLPFTVIALTRARTFTTFTVCGSPGYAHVRSGYVTVVRVGFCRLVGYRATRLPVLRITWLFTHYVPHAHYGLLHVHGYRCTFTHGCLRCGCYTFGLPALPFIPRLPHCWFCTTCTTRGLTHAPAVYHVLALVNGYGLFIYGSRLPALDCLCAAFYRSRLRSCLCTARTRFCGYRWLRFGYLTFVTTWIRSYVVGLVLIHLRSFCIRLQLPPTTLPQLPAVYVVPVWLRCRLFYTFLYGLRVMLPVTHRLHATRLRGLRVRGWLHVLPHTAHVYLVAVTTPFGLRSTGFGSLPCRMPHLYPVYVLLRRLPVRVYRSAGSPACGCYRLGYATRLPHGSAPPAITALYTHLLRSYRTAFYPPRLHCDVYTRFCGCSAYVLACCGSVRAGYYGLPRYTVCSDYLPDLYVTFTCSCLPVAGCRITLHGSQFHVLGLLPTRSLPFCVHVAVVLPFLYWLRFAGFFFWFGFARFALPVLILYYAVVLTGCSRFTCPFTFAPFLGYVLPPRFCSLPAASSRLRFSSVRFPVTPVTRYLPLRLIHVYRLRLHIWLVGYRLRSRFYRIRTVTVALHSYYITCLCSPFTVIRRSTTTRLYTF